MHCSILDRAHVAVCRDLRGALLAAHLCDRRRVSSILFASRLLDWSCFPIRPRRVVAKHLLHRMVVVAVEVARDADQSRRGPINFLSRLLADRYQSCKRRPNSVSAIASLRVALGQAGFAASMPADIDQQRMPTNKPIAAPMRRYYHIPPAPDL
jgi:hypothetical protein